MQLLKFCNKCKEEKPTWQFYQDKSKAHGLKAWCKECTNTSTNKHRKANPEKYAEINRRSVAKATLKKKSGITPEEYDKLLVSHRNGCAICGGTNPKRRLTVDRDPRTDLIRGLLCAKCVPKVRALDRDPAKVIVLISQVKNEDVTAPARYVVMGGWNKDDQRQAGPLDETGSHTTDTPQGPGRKAPESS